MPKDNEISFKKLSKIIRRAHKKGAMSGKQFDFMEAMLLAFFREDEELASEADMILAEHYAESPSPFEASNDEVEVPEPVRCRAA